jgi:methionyl-tRNA formyltransferase
MKLVFMGTPRFAAPSLEAIVAGGHDVAVVYTQPDRPKGRGRELAVSPVKEAAARLGLDVRQPARVRQPEVVAELAAIRPDAIAVVGYGQIIPQSVIDIPALGIINVHASLLPKYRGAAPVQWAIANGERVTGVTTMLIDAGLDTGPILLQQETPVGDEETALDLAPRLASMGAELLMRTLEGLAAGAIAPVPQNDAEATLAPILRKEDGLIGWARPARAIFNRARGFLPWPGAWTWFRGQRFNIWKCRPAEGPGRGVGRLYGEGRRLLAGCGDGALELLEVQLEGRKRVTGEAFLHGHRLGENEMVGEASQ